MQTTIKCFKCISPKPIIKTFTVEVDNGGEFSNFNMLEMKQQVKSISLIHTLLATWFKWKYQ